MTTIMVEEERKNKSNIFTNYLLQQQWKVKKNKAITVKAIREKKIEKLFLGKYVHVCKVFFLKLCTMGKK